MALPSITAQDFRGLTKISGNSFRQERLDDYIQPIYNRLVRQVLGAFTWNDAVNNSYEKYDDLFGGKFYEVGNRSEYNDGLRAAIIYLIYFYFIRDDFQSSQVGKVKSKNENSTRNTHAETATVAMQRYNAGIRAIKGSICKFLADFKVVDRSINSVVDNLNGTFTVNLSSTLYMVEGEQVTIGNTTYEASNVVANTSFDVTSIDAPTGDIATWKPFGRVELDTLEFITI